MFMRIRDRIKNKIDSIDKGNVVIIAILLIILLGASLGGGGGGY
jgi:hypothetical protein